MSPRDNPITRTVLTELQRTIGQINAEHGFHEEGEALRRPFRQGEPGEIVVSDEGDVRALTNYWALKLALIHSEASEALDEIRNGHAVNETYYPTARKVILTETHIEGDALVGTGSLPVGPFKPEGFPSEIADVVIRCFDLASEAEFDLGAIILEKMAYNATRPFKHGKKF